MSAMPKGGEKGQLTSDKGRPDKRLKEAEEETDSEHGRYGEGETETEEELGKCQTASR